MYIIMLYIFRYGVFKDINLERFKSINLYTYQNVILNNNLSKVNKAGNVESIY